MIQASELIGNMSSRTIKYNKKDQILYALGIGCTELKYVYENHENFCAHALFPHSLLWDGTTVGDVTKFVVPFGLESGNVFALHGEQKIEILRQIPLEGIFTIQNTVLDVQEKKNGVLMIMESQMADKTNIYCKMTCGFFLVNAKGGNKVNVIQETWEIPDRSPDKKIEYKTHKFQAMLYRLSGDYNPLHIDPQVATRNGLPEPNLQGLCTFGYCGNAIIDLWCDGDQEHLGSISCRFSTSVYPGETLLVETWKMSPVKVIYQVIVKERNLVCLTNGIALLKQSIQSKM